MTKALVNDNPFTQLRTQALKEEGKSRFGCWLDMDKSLSLSQPWFSQFWLHVDDRKENLEGFVKTSLKCPPADGNPCVFAVSCECCTAKGLELTQVTVVDPSLQVVYDTFVKPDEEVIDYNTRFSGVEDDLRNTRISIQMSKPPC
ncbi:putative exonuclease GOR [Lutra lutra]|uniref:putative exonuclease GOR n=1 Tax=Lutra lutra TaxID=9657 RepID=UPI001FD3D8C7|nr:putative exonuclease GOR [Lutra lutra]